MKKPQNHSLFEKFNYKNYFDCSTDYWTPDNVPYVKLSDQGTDVVAEYYNVKYHLEHLSRMASVNDLILKLKSLEFKKKYCTPDNDVRVPFIINSMVEIRRTLTQSGHSSPTAYIKEEKKEAILYFDSLGSTLDAEELAKQTGLKVYTIQMGRQRDYYSCHTDALVFCRLMAAKDEKGNYLIPNLLAFLEKNSIDSSKNPVVVKLPDNLLITAQRLDFIQANKKGDVIVHTGNKYGPENIDMFLKHRPEKADYGKDAQPASDYLRQKGLKYANIIEIQFYLKQLETRLGSVFTKDLRKQFVKEAKEKLVSQGEVNHDNLRSRAGLHQFTQAFFEKNGGAAKNTSNTGFSSFFRIFDGFFNKPQSQPQQHAKNLTRSNITFS